MQEQISSDPKLSEIIQSGVSLTPMMQQYAQIKSQYPETLLLYRMGDFYELFFEDAKKASELLNITLTHRGKLGDFPIPMAGIPHHAAANYIDRLTQLGLRVVICEQTENPKEAKGIVARAVSQIVGPAMPFEIDRIDPRDQRFLACASIDDKTKEYYLALIDFTTGHFKGHKCGSEEEWLEYFILHDPREVVTFIGQWDSCPLISRFLEQKTEVLKTNLNSDYFSLKGGKVFLEKCFPGLLEDRLLRQESKFIPALCALSSYLLSTQGEGKISHIRPFHFESPKGLMRVSASTLQGLEILPRHRDFWKQSLLGFLDKTKTALGPRLLTEYFQKPITDLKIIKSRQNLIAHLIENVASLEIIRQGLTGIRDLERLMAKVSTSKVNAQDLLSLAQSLERWESLGHQLIESTKQLFEVGLEEELIELKAEILSSLNPEIGASVEKGNLFIEGKFKERDRLAKLSHKSAQSLLELENQLRAQTGINNLKIKTNNISGHFIEISKSHLTKVPKSFIRRQTLVNAERFSCEKLENLEKEIISANSKLLALERELFNNLVKQVEARSTNISDLSKKIARLDVFQSLSYLAYHEQFCCPDISPKEQLIEIEEGFHPLIKSDLGERFTPHNIRLGKGKNFGLITGPNMAGKTTVMREVAIIQFLAQIGSYVPAKSAHLGLCDAIFSRLGAHDNILQGQSTFMVEMAETAEIIRHASSKSLVIVDELGRGTSTYDGLSLAWSLVEHFTQNLKALTLFSTHYHELIEVVEGLKEAKNFTVETVDCDGEITFLYRLIEKGASQSYGIHVAKLAGLPNKILQRAQVILKELEGQHHYSRTPLYLEIPSPEGMQLSFLEMAKNDQTAPRKNSPQPEVITKIEVPTYLEKLEKEIRDTNINNLTPLEALNLLGQLQKSLKDMSN